MRSRGWDEQGKWKKSKGKNEHEATLAFSRAFIPCVLRVFLPFALCLLPFKNIPPHDISRVPSPSYVLEEALLRRNLGILDRVQRESGAKIILALKGFAFWGAFPWIREVLHGATASSLHEARLASEELGRETHV